MVSRSDSQAPYAVPPSAHRSRSWLPIIASFVAHGVWQPASIRGGPTGFDGTVGATRRDRMKAALVRELGELDGVTLGEIEPPTVGPGQVMIDVAACAVNFPDVLMVRGMYQEKPRLPFSPGQEVAGVVSAVGDGVDGIGVGDRVFAGTGV